MNASLRIIALLERAGLPAPSIGMPNEEAWELVANALEQLPAKPNHAKEVFRLVADQGIQAYLRKLNSEKEYLIAAYMAQTGLKPSEIVLVIHDDRFYPAHKMDHEGPVKRVSRNQVQRAIDELVEETKLENDYGLYAAGARLLVAKLGLE